MPRLPRIWQAPILYTSLFWLWWESHSQRDWPQLEDIENFAGQYQNVIEELRRRRKEDQEEEGVLLDIEYELESIRTDEINYHYILSLIQALIENRENIIGKKEKSLVDNYIEDLNKSNPKLSSIISKLWQDVQADAKSYQGQSVTHKLDEMIELTTQQKIRETADYWQIGEDELQFVVDNYRIGRDKQNGEKPSQNLRTTSPIRKPTETKRYQNSNTKKPSKRTICAWFQRISYR